VLKEGSVFGSEYRIDHNLRNFVPVHRNSVHPTRELGDGIVRDTARGHFGRTHERGLEKERIFIWQRNLGEEVASARNEQDPDHATGEKRSPPTPKNASTRAVRPDLAGGTRRTTSGSG
jgi:hypothetical protein